MTTTSAPVPRSLVWVVGVALGACTHPEGTGLGSFSGASGNDTSELPNLGTGGSGGVASGGGAGEGPPGVVVDGNLMGEPPPMVEVCGAAVYSDKYTPGQNVPPSPSDAELQGILNLMSLEEKIKQLQGVATPAAGAAGRYDDIQRSLDAVLLDGTVIRGYFYRDAGRGLNLAAPQVQRQSTTNYSTLFPVAAARGASFDLELEYQIGEAIGDETVATNNSMLLAPCMNILRHPYWGRAQETYGEDVFHLGRMASALTAGLQTNVAACAKHFAANNIEDDRANNNAVMDEQTLREIYGRHFEMVVQDGGVACVMAAYNAVNDVKSTQSAHLLTDILREDFGFQGLVISDWWAMPGDQGPVQAASAIDQAREALEAGLDIEVPWTLNYGQLGQLVAQGAVSADQVNVAAGRILRQKMRFNALYADEPIGLKATTTTILNGQVANNGTHIELARRAAIESMVLVKNDNATLPIKTDGSIDTIAVIGPVRTYALQSTTGQPDHTCANAGATISCQANFATQLIFGDRGSSRVNPDPASTIGPTAGMTQVASQYQGITVISGDDAPDAAEADFVVVVVGLTPGDEGEEYAIPAGGDRSTLTLPDGQDALIQRVIALQKPMVVVVESGGIINMPWLAQVPAVVMAWYPGQQGGLALAELLFGRENFSAKMPVAWPQEADLPPFKDSEFETNMGYFLGYRLLDEQGRTPIFPFGHGLSYSSFSYSNLQLGCPTAAKDGVIPVTVDVRNDSPIAGEEVVFAFVSYPETTARRSVKELKGFQKVALGPNETKSVTIRIRVQDLKYWQGDENGQWVVESGPIEIRVGKSAAEADLTLRGSVQVL